MPSFEFQRKCGKPGTHSSRRVALLLVAMALIVAGLTRLEPAAAAEQPDPTDRAQGAHPSAASGKGGTAATDASDAERRDRNGDPLPPRCLARLGTLRLRQEEPIIASASYSPNGMLLATFGLNSAPVYLWDVKSGALVRLLRPEELQSRPRTMAFSPDSKRLVVGEQSGNVRLWDVESGRELLFLEKPHRGRRGVTSAAFAQDGMTFATGGAFGWVYRWNAATGEQVGTLQASQPAPSDKGGGPTFSVVVALAFSPDGTSLAAGAGFQESIGFMDTVDEERKAVRNPNGESIVIWNLNPQKRLRTIAHAHPTEIISLAWTPDGKRIFSGGNIMMPREKFGKPYGALFVIVPEVKVWDVETGDLVRELKADEPEAGYGAMALDGNGTILASGGEPAIRLWDVRSEKLLRRIAVPGWHGMHGLALSPDGQEVVADRKGKIGVWEVATGEVAPRFANLQSHSRGVVAVAVSPKGERMFTASHDGTVRAWHAETGEPIFERSGGEEPTLFCMELSPDGTLLATGGSNRRMQEPTGGEVQLWSARTGDPIRTLGGPLARGRVTQHLAFSSDSRRLASATSGGRDGEVVDIWDLESGGKLAQIRPDPSGRRVRVLAVSPDVTRLFIVAPQPAVVSIWDAASGESKYGFLLDENATPEEAQDPKYRRKVQITDAVINPQCTQIIVSADSRIVIWDLATKRPVQTFETPGRQKTPGRLVGRKLGLSRDGRLLATTEWADSEDGMNAIQVWDLAAGRQVAQFASSDGLATAFAFSSDGTRLAAGTMRGTTLVWQLP